MGILRMNDWASSRVSPVCVLWMMSYSGKTLFRFGKQRLAAIGDRVGLAGCSEPYPTDQKMKTITPASAWFFHFQSCFPLIAA